MSPILLLACTQPSKEPETETTDDPSRPVLSESDLSPMWDRVNAMTASTPPGREVTESAETGYVTATVGTTYNGDVNGFSTYTIDGNTVYGGVAYNTPTWTNAGTKDDSYDAADYADEAGAITIAATQEYVVGDSEGEKNPEATPTETYPSGFYWGNNYRFVAQITEAAPCPPASPVQQVSDFAATESEEVPAEVANWFAAVDGLQSQTPLSDEDLGWPDENVSETGTLQRPPHPDRYVGGNSAITGVYRVAPGPLTSNSELGSGVYQQEYGLRPVAVTYEDFAVGTLPAAAVAASADWCFPAYESDSGYGSSGYTQAPVAVGGVMDDLEDSGEPAQFTLITAHDLDDEKTVIVAYCKPDGTPVYDYDGLSTSPAPVVANFASWADQGYVLGDASPVYCGQDLLTGYDGAPMTGLWAGATELSRNP